MIKRKIQLSWKNVSLFSLSLIGTSWLGFSVWNYLGSSKVDPWRQTSDSSARLEAEKEGKMILFLIEPESCFDCKEIRTAFESFQRLQNFYKFDSIDAKTDQSRYEAISVDDRYAEELGVLSEGKAVWGVRNVSDEILFLKKGVPELREESILIELAEKNRFRSKESEQEQTESVKEP